MALDAHLFFLSVWSLTTAMFPPERNTDVWGFPLNTDYQQAPLQREVTASDTSSIDRGSHTRFYNLPMFKHTRGPLLAPDLLRPVTGLSQLPPALISLLFPAATQTQIGHSTNVPGVDIRCGNGKISVRIDRLLLAYWSEPSLFRLGSCMASRVDSQFLFFHYDLGECQGSLKTVRGQLVYTNYLFYTPPPQNIIVRVAPLDMPIYCHFNRFHYSYQVGYRPQVLQRVFLTTIHRKSSFSLTVCNAQWQPLGPGGWFSLGEPVYFVAQTEPLTRGERLYLDSCYATTSKDPNTMPRLDIIKNYGCMADSEREGSHSQFWNAGNFAVKFSVDAFLFPGVKQQLLYLHCSVSVSSISSPTSKSCNFNNITDSWEELMASPSVCSCCETMCTDTQRGSSFDPSVATRVISSAGWHVWERKGDVHMEQFGVAVSKTSQTEEGTPGMDEEKEKKGEPWKEEVETLKMQAETPWKEGVKNKLEKEEKGAIEYKSLIVSEEQPTPDYSVPSHTPILEEEWKNGRANGDTVDLRIQADEGVDGLQLATEGVNGQMEEGNILTSVDDLGWENTTDYEEVIVNTTSQYNSSNSTVVSTTTSAPISIDSQRYQSATSPSQRFGSFSSDTITSREDFTSPGTIGLISQGSLVTEVVSELEVLPGMNSGVRTSRFKAGSPGPVVGELGINQVDSSHDRFGLIKWLDNEDLTDEFVAIGPDGNKVSQSLWVKPIESLSVGGKTTRPVSAKALFGVPDSELGSKLKVAHLERAVEINPRDGVQSRFTAQEQDKVGDFTVDKEEVDQLSRQYSRLMGIDEQFWY